METADLFAQCDPDSKGWFGPGDLSRVCPQLSEDELRYVFDELDINKDGKVSREEFMAGFEKVINQGEKAAGYKGLKRRASILPRDLSVCSRLLKSAPSEVVYGSDPETTAKLDHLPCQKDVLALYEQLQNVGVPQVLSQFEKVIGTFSREIGEQKEQNERLQHIYANEKEYYNKRMLDVETELDQQITLTEQRARQEERERLEKEKAEMRRRLEEEVSELRSNIKRVQRMETIISDKDHSERLVELKNKLQEMTGENRNLKSNLTQNQVEVALIKGEMAQLRGDYEEKCVDLVAEKDNINSMIHERDNLTRQLQLLYDANKKLHDTNDSLRIAMESRNAICRQFNLRSPSPGGGGKMLTRQQNFSRDGLFRASIRSDCSASSSRIHSSVAGTLQQPLNGAEDDDDSGVARGSDGVRSGFNSEWSEDGATDPESSTLPPLSYRSHASSITIRRDSDMVRTLKYTIADYAATGPAERTFRVVLAGDASVGKTALIMRLVKGTFVSDLPATLGVDFHVIGLRVDGKNLALQLWDTAGQERFRSMCKSYFRRADGAFLVYDVTSERSFLNVRNWMETIQECVQRKIPVLLCGNKVDLRIAYAADGKRCIAEQDGQKLAKISDTLFFEVSAKDGSNVLEATVSLARDLLANEDCEVQDSSLLLNQTPAPASATGGRCGSANRCSK